MAVSFNQVTIAGNLTRDPELKHIANGSAVCELGIAINERVKRGDQWVDEAVFLDVTLWGKTAETAAEYLAKGSSVLIAGRLKLDTWEKDGKRNSKLRVVGERMQMLGGKSEAKPQAAATSYKNPNKFQPTSDDAPF